MRLYFSSVIWYCFTHDSSFLNTSVPIKMIILHQTTLFLLTLSNLLNTGILVMVCRYIRPSLNVKVNTCGQMILIKIADTICRDTHIFLDSSLVPKRTLLSINLLFCIGKMLYWLDSCINQIKSFDICTLFWKSNLFAHVLHANYLSHYQ